MHRYELLYNLAKDVLAEEQNRLNRIDDKASKYLPAITFLVGVYGFITKPFIGMIFPPDNWFEWIVIGLIIFTLGYLVKTWLGLFQVMRLRKILKLPLSDDMIEFIYKNSETTVQYWLAKRMKEAYSENKVIIDLRSNKLDASHMNMRVCVFALSLLFISYYVLEILRKLQ